MLLPLFAFFVVSMVKANIETVIDFDSGRRLPDYIEPIESACDRRFYSDRYGYHCPHMFMLSDDMIVAQQRDNLLESKLSYLYAVAGSYNDMECGKCYLVRINEPSAYPYLVLQVINSGRDIQRGHFDIMIPAGGFGYYNACTKDCQNRYCQGGPCQYGAYDGQFEDWNSQKSSCYEGGIDWKMEDGIEKLFQTCKSLVGVSNKRKDRTTFQSCVRANLSGFYRNFQNMDYTRVKCPDAMIAVTGMQRQDDLYCSLPNENTTFDFHCRSPDCITTMNDCCKPACAWQKNIATEWNRVYTCDQNGDIFQRS